MWSKNLTSKGTIVSSSWSLWSFGPQLQRPWNSAGKKLNTKLQACTEIVACEMASGMHTYSSVFSGICILEYAYCASESPSVCYNRLSIWTISLEASLLAQRGPRGFIHLLKHAASYVYKPYLVEVKDQAKVVHSLALSRLTKPEGSSNKVRTAHAAPKVRSMHARVAQHITRIVGHYSQAWLHYLHKLDLRLQIGVMTTHDDYVRVDSVQHSDYS